MASPAQTRATAAHRRRAAQRGLVRVEVQTSRHDASLIRAAAEVLRSGGEAAEAVRRSLEPLLAVDRAADALELFGSDLEDEAFEGVFERSRGGDWRDGPL
jgi:hypothetical protein